MRLSITCSLDVTPEKSARDEALARAAAHFLIPLARLGRSDGWRGMARLDTALTFWLARLNWPGETLCSEFGVRGRRSPYNSNRIGMQTVPASHLPLCFGRTGFPVPF